MEEVNEFKYVGLILCKQVSVEGEVRKKGIQGRKVVGSLRHVTNGRTVNMEIKKRYYMIA